MTGDPKRLTVVGATDLERNLLQAARQERPSPELTKRMAAGLGISVAAVATAAAPAAAAAPVVATKATALAAWVSAGAIVVAAAAGVVAVRFGSTPAQPTPAGTPVSTGISTLAVPPAGAPVAEPAPDIITEKRIEKIRKHPAPPPVGDLRDQIALVDAARTAVKSGATDRALALLKRYETTYPSGAFRPEVLALRIEALDDAGRGAEARSLAREFLARYPQSPVADRVARIGDTK